MVASRYRHRLYYLCNFTWIIQFQLGHDRTRLQHSSSILHIVHTSQEKNHNKFYLKKTTLIEIRIGNITNSQKALDNLMLSPIIVTIRRQKQQIVD